MESAFPMVFVFGHRRPDTDSAVSAVVAARLLARCYPGRRFQPLLLGPVGPQTEWLFAQAGECLPPIRDDIRPTARECCRAPISVRPETSLGETLDLLRTRGFSMVPVTDADGRLVGLLSPHLEESRYLFHFNTEDFLGVLLGMGEVVGALGLQPANEAAKGELREARAFRIYQTGREIQQGDLVLAAVGAAAIGAAAEAGAAGLVCCESPGDEIREAAGSRPDLPVWIFPGSLMALITELPRAIPVGRVMSPVGATATGAEALDDLRPLLARIRHALPLVDEAGKLTGILSRQEAIAPPRPGAVLVDHFEHTQTVRGLDEAEVLEIIDHHRVGSLETRDPVRVDCRPVGSTATLLALRFDELEVTPSRSDALLLLGALVADTLLLTSPTATATDREVASRLAAVAGVDLHGFGREVLARNDGLALEEPSALVGRDLKEFSQNGTRFLVGQIETVDLALLTPRRAEALGAALAGALGRFGAAFALLMVTDVIAGCSRVLIADSDERRARALLGGADPRGETILEGVVSRKKQMLPLVLRRLAEFPHR